MWTGPCSAASCYNMLRGIMPQGKKAAVILKVIKGIKSPECFTICKIQSRTRFTIWSNKMSSELDFGKMQCFGHIPMHWLAIDNQSYYQHLSKHTFPHLYASEVNGHFVNDCCYYWFLYIKLPTNSYGEEIWTFQHHIRLYYFNKLSPRNNRLSMHQ